MIVTGWCLLSLAPSALVVSLDSLPLTSGSESRETASVSAVVGRYHTGGSAQLDSLALVSGSESWKPNSVSRTCPAVGCQGGNGELPLNDLCLNVARTSAQLNPLTAGGRR